MQITDEQKQDIQIEKKAKEYIKEGHGIIDAYHYAFEDCIN